MSNKTLIILGMHRSGTSLTARWLQECGLHIGERLAGSGTGNKDGHFEDLDFHDIHEESFVQRKIPYGGIEKIKPLELTEYEILKLNFLIKFKNEMNHIWGFKEPRTCLFLEYYNQLIPQAKYYVIYRHYTKVVDSLIRRDIKILIKKHTSSGQYQRYKFYLNKDKLIHKINNKANIYLKAWNIYNKKILNHLDKVPSNNFIINDIENVNSSSVLSSLNQWQFNLNNIPFSKIYNPDLLNEKNINIEFNNKLLVESNEIILNLQNLHT
ncbi:hypothetical protein H4J46_12355 [Colwellia sp. MB02u-6]|uniref:hypothetical protein n=1 Tax=Colwellia sp. MB02u-6 TaxID=2759824 RepID=UPI0015F40C67|nr:hypothetical protein [Colwellia sp. MB02u-6]MBA6328720.1 hypothetical protein [Colwellia sp. MB02u-6]